jgi:hypothetical protein
MADQLFSTSPYGKALFNTYGARRPTLAVLGDSYGAFLSTAIQYACARYYAADIDFDHRPAASGGRLFSVGGSPSSHVPGTQIPSSRRIRPMSHSSGPATTLPSTALPSRTA